MANKIPHPMISRMAAQLSEELDVLLFVPKEQGYAEQLWESYLRSECFLYTHRCTFKIGHIGANMTFHISNKWEPAFFLLLMAPLHTFQIWLGLRCESHLYSCQCEILPVYAYCRFTVRCV